MSVVGNTHSIIMHQTLSFRVIFQYYCHIFEKLQILSELLVK